MDRQQNLELVQRGYEAFGRGDLDGLLALLDESVEWRSPGPADLPTAGTRRGKQQVAEFFRALGEMLDMQRFEPQTFLADGDRVIVLGDDTARIKATGEGARQPVGAHVHREERQDHRLRGILRHGSDGGRNPVGPCDSVADTSFTAAGRRGKRRAAKKPTTRVSNG